MRGAPRPPPKRSAKTAAMAAITHGAPIPCPRFTISIRSSHSRRQLPTRRSAWTLAFGALSGVTITRAPSDSSTASALAANLHLHAACRDRRGCRRSGPVAASGPTRRTAPGRTDTAQRPVEEEEKHETILAARPRFAPTATNRPRSEFSAPTVPEVIVAELKPGEAERAIREGTDKYVSPDPRRNRGG